MNIITKMLRRLSDWVDSLFPTEPVDGTWAPAEALQQREPVRCTAHDHQLWEDMGLDCPACQVRKFIERRSA